MLARFAHDLELEATGVSGKVVTEDDRWTVSALFPVAGVKVVGALRGRAVDPSVLSRRDVAEIERRIREEVFGGASVEVRGAGKGMRGALEILAPRGRDEVQVVCSRDDEVDRRIVRVATRLSLGRLGCAEVKAPLGAFRVADSIEIDATVVFEPATSPRTGSA